jgi:hypothetical protein
LRPAPPAEHAPTAKRGDVIARSTEPKLVPAPVDGVYHLYAEGQPVPQKWARLRRGDQLGFGLDNRGSLVGLAPKRDYSFPAGQSAEWRLEAIKPTLGAATRPATSQPTQRRQ